MPILGFAFESFLTGLVWAGMVVLNLWLFQKSKANGNLLMLIGAGLMAFLFLLGSFGASLGPFIWSWFPLFAAILIVWGFYMTVKAIVAANIAGIKMKAQQAMQKKEGTTGGGTGTTP